MRHFLACLVGCALFSSAAHAIVVNIDEAYVVEATPQGDNTWAATGGLMDNETPADTWVQYRRKRGIEVASGCRVDRVLSRPDDTHLVATVSTCER